MSLPNPEKWLSDTKALYETGNVDKLLSAPSFAQGLEVKLKQALSIAELNLKIVSESENYTYAKHHFEADLEFADRLCNSFGERSVSHHSAPLTKSSCATPPYGFVTISLLI